MSKFKGGDRVLLDLIVHEDCGKTVVVKHTSDGSGFEVPSIRLRRSSPPTPAEKLRAAAKVLDTTDLKAVTYVPDILADTLRRCATHLEAAADPKPTLREAVKCYLDALDKDGRAAARPIREALAREEASKS